MATITASDVKELRELTGIGMMACKKALTEANGDKDAALKILKEKGLAVAAKRADRETTEGQILIKSEGSRAYMLKVGSETDFVAKNSDFIEMCDTLLKNVSEKGISYIGSPEQTEMVTDFSAKTGEKIQISESAELKTENGYIESYLHSNKKVGVIIEIKCPQDLINNEELVTFAKDITMQIAAMNPIALTHDDIDEKTKNEQKELFMAQMADSGKPKEIIEKIVLGKLNKQLAELCLVEMVFVKDSKLKIKDLVKNISKKLNADISLGQFKRMQIGA